MSRVRGKDTRPELMVRRLLHGLGYRYRLHRRDLPGTPDLVFPGLRKIILVHGCFWHRHDCPSGRRIPKSNCTFWEEKIESNRSRDVKNLKALQGLGWDVLVIWECEVRDRGTLMAKARDFLGPRI